MDAKIDKAKKEGIPEEDLLPDWYFKWQPRDHLDEFYLGSFWDLSTCRMLGMSAGPIPWTAIVNYADRMHLDADVCELFTKVIQLMDTTYLEFMEKSRNK